MNLNNLNSVQKTVEYYHSLFLAENIGYMNLPREDRDLLKSRGYKIPSRKKYDDLLTLAYKFGKLSTEGDDKFLNSLKYDRFAIQATEKMKLTTEDKHVVSDLKAHFYTDVKRAQNRVKDDVLKHLLALNKDRRYYIRTKLKRRFTDQDLQITPAMLNELSKYLGQKIKDWATHFDLITMYNMHRSFQNGVASAALEKHGNKVKCYYHVHSDACQVCKDLLLHPSGQPRIFYLMNVLKNGDNIGKKRDEMKAIVGSIHPQCRCRIVIISPKMKANGKSNT